MSVSQVHQLEAANAQLELQIKEHLERSSLGDCKDMGGHLGMIDNLQNQVGLHGDLSLNTFHS